MQNDLAKETSPYLLQHRDNPVHWQAWGPAALVAAATADKPILLSVGYAACHWCHVMAHESFESPTIADLMNTHFVSIKVDREERPDLDAIYQSALNMLGEQGGWPLTMFLTPQGEPYWGGTYFPPERRWGRPGFPEVLERMAHAYKSEREGVDKDAAALVKGLRDMAVSAKSDGPSEVSPELLDRVAMQLLQGLDTVHGGLGGAPKFPQTTALELLWRAHLRTGDARFAAAVTLSIDRMCQGGIYDHLGGGFARYSTDDAWLVPHFEKMLYDNALLIELLSQVWAATGTPLYETRVRETVAWTLREMTAEGGGFAASLDADSEGEEGKFYVWGESEIDALLGDGAAAFKDAYDAVPAGNWEGKTILNRTQRPELGSGEAETALAAMREVLLKERSKRVWPGWDDKVLADWNGLMIAALVTAATAFDEPVWLAAAETAFGFITGSMSDGDGLLRVARAGRAHTKGMVDDYANMTRAALALFEATGDDTYLTRARTWAKVLDERFWDETQGGYFQTPSDGEVLIARPRSAADNATPAGNGTMVGVLARLYFLTGEDAYRARADALIEAFAPELGRNFFPLATFLNGFDLATRAVQVAVIGERGDAATRALLAATAGPALANRILLVTPPGASLPVSHPAHGKTALDGQATAYFCVGTTCSPPVTAPEALAAALPGPNSP